MVYLYGYSSTDIKCPKCGEYRASTIPHQPSNSEPALVDNVKVINFIRDEVKEYFDNMGYEVIE